METITTEAFVEETDFEMARQEPDAKTNRKAAIIDSIKYLLIGAYFGIVLTKSEVISWYRIQEMFRLQSFHMYGVIGSAVVTGMISIWLIKRFKIKTLDGRDIVLPERKFHKGQIYGGLIFGLGWAITGACPGPLFALVGAGYPIMAVSLISAIAGTWLYGYFRDTLPH